MPATGCGQAPERTMPCCIGPGAWRGPGGSSERNRMKAIGETLRGRRRFWIATVIAAAILTGALFGLRPHSRVSATAQPAAIPVTVALAAREDVPLYLTGLGTVAASNTVAIRSQIDGKLKSVNFTEGQA